LKFEKSIVGGENSKLSCNIMFSVP